MPCAPRTQMAALCFRRRGDALQVLLITSLHTGRWIIPKGWPMKGRRAFEVAAVEAWEEAGVVPAHVGKKPLGSFDYLKRLSGGEEVACRTLVFPIEVTGLADSFPHEGRRKRRWAAPQDAAGAVDEPGLQEILISLPSLLSAEGC